MRTILIIFIYFISVSSSLADQNSSRLDPLFKELTQIKNELAADLILAEIWSIWSKTDNEMAQEIFEEGNQLMSKGQFEESIQDIEKTLSLEPRHFGALDGLAQIYFLQDKFLKAAATYEQLLQILPFSENAKRQLERINGKFI